MMKRYLVDPCDNCDRPKSPFKRGTLSRVWLSLVGLTLLASCGDSKVKLDTAALTPLINARHLHFSQQSQ